MAGARTTSAQSSAVWWSQMCRSPLHLRRAPPLRPGAAARPSCAHARAPPQGKHGAAGGRAGERAGGRGSLEGEVDAAVLGHGAEHVVKEADPRVDVVLACRGGRGVSTLRLGRAAVARSTRRSPCNTQWVPQRGASGRRRPAPTCHRGAPAPDAWPPAVACCERGGGGAPPMPSMLISHAISVSLVLREMLAVRAMLACLPTGEGGRSARCSERERSVKVDTDPKLSTRLGFCGVALCASGARRGGLGREHVRRLRSDAGTHRDRMGQGQGRRRGRGRKLAADRARDRRGAAGPCSPRPLRIAGSRARARQARPDRHLRAGCPATSACPGSCPCARSRRHLTPPPPPPPPSAPRFCPRRTRSTRPTSTRSRCSTSTSPRRSRSRGRR